MDYRPLGQTGLRVSSLSLGTVELGLNYGIARNASDGLPPPTRSDAVRLIRQALDAGISLIDTARGYGSSEAVVGEALRGRRASTFIATKVSCMADDGSPLRGDALRRRIQDSIHTSLATLQTDHVDLLMIHSAPPELLQAGEALAMLAECRQAGLTRSFGASTYGAESPRLAIEQGAQALQIAYNVLDQRMADEIFPLAQARGVGMIIRSVYLKGALTDRAEDLPERLEPLKALSRRFRERARQHGIEPAQAALRFVLSRGDVSSVLVGVRDSAELSAALSAAEAGALPPPLLDALQPLRTDEETLLNPSYWGIP